MKYFSAPADFNNHTIDEYQRLNTIYKDCRLIETYGNITLGNYFGSGRLNRQQAKVDLFDLRNYIEYSRSKGIEFNYTINAPHLQNQEFTAKGICEINGFLGKLYDAGVRDLTITLPSLIELTQASPYDFKIKASTICQIVNANRAEAYKRMGVEKIVVDESINRNFTALKNIRNTFGEKVELIVNQVCDLNCIYRIFHYNMISGEPAGTVNDVSINYYEHRCVLQQYKNIENLLKLSWIRPEDIQCYTNIGISYFKLQGRHTFIKKGNPLKTLECYFKGEHDGNLMDLLTMFSTMNNFKIYIDNKQLQGFIKPFYEVEHFCQNNCLHCNHCKTFARRCIDFEKAREIIGMAEKFYNDFDRYKQLINDLPRNITRENEPKLLEVNGTQLDGGDFDF